MKPRIDPSTPLLAAVAAMLLALAWSGGAFIASDESLAYRASLALGSSGDDRIPVPFTDWAHGAFSPMMRYSDQPLASIAVSTTFLGIYAPAAAAGILALLIAMACSTLIMLWLFHKLCARMIGREAAAFALALFATAPPLLFFGSMFFANIPALALGLAATVLALRFDADGRRRWAVATILAAVLTIAMRRDAVVLILPAAAVIFWKLSSSARGRIALVGGSVLAVGAFLYVNRPDPSIPLWQAIVPTPQLIERAVPIWRGVLRDTHASFDPAVLRHNAASILFWAFPGLAIVGGLGALALPRLPRDATLVLLGLTSACLAYLAFYLPWDVTRFGDPPGLFSSLLRYTFVVPLVLAIFAAAWIHFTARHAGRAVSLTIVTILALSGVTEALLADPGAAWLAHERENRSALAVAADQTPPETVLVGDELTKIVHDRTILTPANVGPDEPSIAALLSHLDRLGRPIAVHRDAYFDGDWSGPISEYVSGPGHATFDDGSKFLQITPTTTALIAVGPLNTSDWKLERSGTLISTKPHSEFLPMPSVGRTLTAGTGAVRVSWEARECDTRSHSAGYVEAPRSVNDVHASLAWVGAGDCRLHARAFIVPVGTIVNGAFYISEDIELTRLAIESLGSTVDV